MLNFKQIIEAWIIAGEPTEAQRELAEGRGAICDECPSKVKSTLWDYKCNECGCPIGKKIFTNEYNPCPLKKWKDIDESYFPNTKKNKTLF